VFVACRNIEFDAAETVSMFQEKWAWDRTTFLSFARHYQTKEQLSEDVYDTMMQMRRFGQGRVVILAVLCLTAVFNFCWSVGIMLQDRSTPDHGT
jgi:Zn-dependent oligopeptidase